MGARTEGSRVGDELVEAFEDMAAYLRGEVEVESYEVDKGALPPSEQNRFRLRQVTIITKQLEVRLLQTVVAALAAIPTLTGLAGVLLGPDFLRLDPPWPADLDSHFRFLSGVFLAVGIGFYSTVPDIEAKGARFRLLAALVISGGVARLVSLFVAGSPSAGHLAGLAMELLVVPLLVLWQWRVAAIGVHSHK